MSVGGPVTGTSYNAIQQTSCSNISVDTMPHQDAANVQCLVNEVLQQLWKHETVTCSVSKVQGLIGITMDNNEVFLIEISEHLQQSKVKGAGSATQEMGGGGEDCEEEEDEDEEFKDKFESDNSDNNEVDEFGCSEEGFDAETGYQLPLKKIKLESDLQFKADFGKNSGSRHLIQKTGTRQLSRRHKAPARDSDECWEPGMSDDGDAGSHNKGKGRRKRKIENRMSFEKTRQNKKRSEIWKHFSKEEGESAECKLCRQRINVTQVDSLWDHVQKCDKATSKTTDQITYAFTNEMMSPPDSWTDSKVWQFFRKPVHTCRCLHCDQLVVCPRDGSTGPMWKHLHQCAKANDTEDEPGLEVNLRKDLVQKLQSLKEIQAENLQKSSTKIDDVLPTIDAVQRRRRPKSSYAWNHFDEGQDRFSQCNYCKNVIKVTLPSLKFKDNLWLWEHLMGCTELNQNDRDVLKSVMDTELKTRLDLTRSSQGLSTFKTELWQHVLKPYSLVTCRACSKQIRRWITTGTSSMMLRHVQRCPMTLNEKKNELQNLQYKCPMCPYVSANKDTVVGHCKKVHGQIVDVQDDDEHSSLLDIPDDFPQIEVKMEYDDDLKDLEALEEAISQVNDDVNEDYMAPGTPALNTSTLLEENLIEPRKRNAVWQFFTNSLERYSHCYYCNQALASLVTPAAAFDNTWLWQHLLTCPNLTEEQRQVFEEVKAAEENEKYKPYRTSHLFKHVRKPHTVATCKFCSATIKMEYISSPDLLWRHLQSCANPTPEACEEVKKRLSSRADKNQFLCDQCSFTTLHRISLEKHIQRKHPDT